VYCDISAVILQQLWNIPATCFVLCNSTDCPRWSVKIELFYIAAFIAAPTSSWRPYQVAVASESSVVLIQRRLKAADICYSDIGWITRSVENCWFRYETFSTLNTVLNIPIGKVVVMSGHKNLFSQELIIASYAVGICCQVCMFICRRVFYILMQILPFVLRSPPFLICHLTECKFFIGNRQHNTLRRERGLSF